MLVKLEKLNPEEIAEITALLEKNVLPHLQPDVSNYAKGRQRVWLPYEAPLGNQPFTPGLMDDEIWQWIVDQCAKRGFRAQVALISKGGNINPHGDTTYADTWAMGFNLGKCDWHIQNDRNAERTPARPSQADLDAFYQSPTTSHMSLTGGEVFRFNCKCEHAVTNAAPDRWSINVWAIADGPAAERANIARRLEQMLEKHPEVQEFIDLHQPGAQQNQPEAIEHVPQITNTQEETVNTNQITTETPSQGKEKKMKIFHWLEESDVTNVAGDLVINTFAKDSEMVMVITNNPTPDRKQAYNDALMGNGSAKYNEQLGLWLMPIKTGAWSFHYLERLDQKGIKFTVTIRRVDLMKEMWDDRDDSDLRTVGEMLIEQANLAWVDNRNLYLVDIDGVPAGGEFDWSLIGITANDAKKLTKRMAEVVRLAKSKRTKNMKVKVLSPETKTNNPDFWVKVFDGKNAIRYSALPEDMQRSLAKKGHMHIMGRGLTKVDGKKVLVKGDFIVVQDALWPHGNVGVVAHGENLKTEVTLEDDAENDLWTFWEHAPLHVTTWDQQTMLNYPRILTVDSMRGDYLAEMNGIDEQLDKGLLPGQVESDFQVQAEEEAHDEFKNLLPKSNEIAKNRDLATQIKNAGFDVRMFENLVGLSLNGYADSKARFMHTNQFDKWGRPDPLFGMHDKHVVQMRNSFRATCVTDTFLKHFVGMSYTANRVARFDSDWGMVWNGEHFARTFELHGTHDNDDQHFFVPVKLWSSDKYTVADLKKAGVMLQSMEIPDKEENAKMVLLVLRLPNGAGEYSIMEFDFDTWPEEIPFDESLVKTHDLCFKEGWVRPQSMVAPKNMPGLPTSRVYSKKSYTRADLVTDLKAQYENPMFGAMCNALVSYSSITNGGIPSCMTDSLGNIVDATQQGADIASFEAINTLMGDIKDELVQIGRKHRLTMNRYFYYRRGAVAKPAIKANVLSVKAGEIEAFDTEYKRSYLQLKANIKNKYSFMMRRNVKINQEILESFSFTPEQVNWAKNFITNMEAQIIAVDNTEIHLPISKFTKPIRQAILRDKRHQVVDAAIAKIEGMKDPHKAILCIWHTILKPYAMSSAAKYGYKDRVVCQMGSEKALAHLLVDAIVAWKNPCADHNPVIDDDRRRCETCGKS